MKDELINQVNEQPKKRFWKTVGTIARTAGKIFVALLPYAKAAADADQLNGTAGAILRKLPPVINNSKNTQDAGNDSK